MNIYGKLASNIHTIFSTKKIDSRHIILWFQFRREGAILEKKELRWLPFPLGLKEKLHKLETLCNCLIMVQKRHNLAE